MATQLVSVVGGAILGLGYATNWSFQLEQQKKVVVPALPTNFTQVREDIKNILLK
jgi:cytochrome c peroxidase